MTHAELKFNYKFCGYLGPMCPQMSNISIFSFKYHIGIDFLTSNLPISSKLAHLPILPQARKMQFMLHNIIFDNFYNHPRKAHKIPVRSPYYTSLWYSYNSKYNWSVKIFSPHPVFFLKQGVSINCNSLFKCIVINCLLNNFWSIFTL